MHGLDALETAEQLRRRNAAPRRGAWRRFVPQGAQLDPFDRAWTFGHADAEAMLRKHTAHGVEEVPALFGLDEAADIAKR